MSGVILLTQEGYDNIVAEYGRNDRKRKEVAERIKEAISYGDISGPNTMPQRTNRPSWKIKS